MRTHGNPKYHCEQLVGMANRCTDSATWLANRGSARLVCDAHKKERELWEAAVLRTRTEFEPIEYVETA
jgi:hypothetical protein